MHTQTDLARFLVEEKGADYVLVAKGNQPTLRDDLADYLDFPYARVVFRLGRRRGAGPVLRTPTPMMLISTPIKKQHRFMARGADACGGMGNYSFFTLPQEAKYKICTQFP